MCTYLNKTGSTYYFRRPVPDDLQGYFKTSTGKPRSEWKFSLGTKDRETAKRRLRPHEVNTDGLIDEARRVLATVKPASGFGEVIENREVSSRAREQAEAYAALAAEKKARFEARAPHRVKVRKMLTFSTAELTDEQAAFRDIIREAEQTSKGPSDTFTDTTSAGRTSIAEHQPGPSRLGLLDLFDRYEALKAANPKTLHKWRGRLEGLIEHLGHDDASQVQRADLNGWAAALIVQGLSVKTVRDGYLPAVRAALNIAFRDGSITTNPAAGLKVLGPKAVKLRELEHSDEEAATILKAALGKQPAGLADHHARARRWVPWLCAYTGARVGEMTQLRAMDIQQEGGIWFIHISPEADGGVKTGEARKVPLHSHLVEQGFTEFAKAGGTSPLFFQNGAGTPLNPASKMRASALAKWVRTLGVETPQPNHGWRHKFKTMCRVAEIPEHVMDKLQGHASLSQGRRYGTIPLGTLRDAIEKLPRFEV